MNPHPWHHWLDTSLCYISSFTHVCWVVDGPAAILPETQRCQNEKDKLQIGFPCLLPTQYPTTIQLGNLWQKAFFVHVTISQLILKEPTPGSWQFARVQS
jgi:hypothetical protein